MFYLSETFPPMNFGLKPHPISYPLLPVSQVAGCRCTLLAGNHSVSLAGRHEEQIRFFPAIPQNAENGFRKLYSHFVVVFRSFSQNFPLGAPDVTFNLSLTDSDTVISMVPRISRELQTTRCCCKN